MSIIEEFEEEFEYIMKIKSGEEEGTLSLCRASTSQPNPAILQEFLLLLSLESSLYSLSIALSPVCSLLIILSSFPSCLNEIITLL